MNLTPAGLHFLDTSAAIDLMKAGMVASSEALLPFVAHGELLTGVYRSVNPTREGARLQSTLGGVPVIYPKRGTVIIYARLTARLQQTGQLIPMNDLWIAALALEWELPLLTGDAHFARVQGLKWLPSR